MPLFAGQQRHKHNRHLAKGLDSRKDSKTNGLVAVVGPQGEDQGQRESSLERGFESSRASHEGDIEYEDSLSDNFNHNPQGVKSYQYLLHTLTADYTPSARPYKRRKTEKDVPLSQLPVEEGSAQTPEISEVDEDTTFDTAGDELPEDKANPYNRHFEDSCRLNLRQLIQSREDGNWFIADVAKQDKMIESRKWSCTFRLPKDTAEKADYQPTRRCRNLDDLYLKKKLRETVDGQMPHFDLLFSHLTGMLFHYQDIMFPLRTLDNAEILRKLACLHSLNHIFKTRDRVIKNNARFAKEGSHMDHETRDQGFTRPKVLILLPTRQACVRYIETLMSLCQPEQQENRKRFHDSFSSTTDNLSDNKPRDFRELFAGNDDDLFRLGIKFTRKTVKFFSRFYNSDMIIASPLALRMALSVGEAKKADYDYLSSIEVFIIDQADALLMQNWEHIDYIVEHLNLQPTEAHGCDFSRVRNWYLDGNARYVRQTLAFSSFNFASLNRLCATAMLNVAGRNKFSRHEEGVISGLSFMPKQTFSRLEFDTVSAEPDSRFHFFSHAVLPTLIKTMKHTQESFGMLILLPSYADFLRVRNHMAAASDTQDISFGAISEYTSVKDVARARSHFLSGRYSVLLYTERAHHFRRYRLKGVKRIVMYGAPENALFYKEIVEDYLGTSVAGGEVGAREASVRTLFSRLDLLKLERIVGSDRSRSMLKGMGGDTFDFT